MVTKAYYQNDDGGGIAYREQDQDGSTVVVWRKDLSLQEMIELCTKAPMPYVAHFRIASSGGILPELCHPFEIARDTPSTTSGRTKNDVLFHNGDWGKWQDVMLQTAIKLGGFPGGRWSDTRALAWLGGVYGIGFYEFINEKLIVFGPTRFASYGYGWKTVNGVTCSNDSFVTRSIGQASPFSQDVKRICRNATCNKDAVWGSIFCQDCQQRVYTTPTALPAAQTTEGGRTNERSPFERRLHSAVKKNPALVWTCAEKGLADGKLSKNAYKRIKKEVSLYIQTADFTKPKEEAEKVVVH